MTTTNRPNTTVNLTPRKADIVYNLETWRDFVSAVTHNRQSANIYKNLLRLFIEAASGSYSRDEIEDIITKNIFDDDEYKKLITEVGGDYEPGEDIIRDLYKGYDDIYINAIELDRMEKTLTYPDMEYVFSKLKSLAQFSDEEWAYELLALPRAYAKYMADFYEGDDFYDDDKACALMIIDCISHFKYFDYNNHIFKLALGSVVDNDEVYGEIIELEKALDKSLSQRYPTKKQHFREYIAEQIQRWQY